MEIPLLFKPHTLWYGSPSKQVHFPHPNSELAFPVNLRISATCHPSLRHTYLKSLFQLSAHLIITKRVLCILSPLHWHCCCSRPAQCRPLLNSLYTFLFIHRSWSLISLLWYGPKCTLSAAHTEWLTLDHIFAHVVASAGGALFSLLQDLVICGSGRVSPRLLAHLSSDLYSWLWCMSLTSLVSAS